MKRLIPILGLAGAVCLLVVFGREQMANELEMTIETRTWCVGRYSIELPSTFEQDSLEATVGLPLAVGVVGLGPGSEKDLERLVDDRFAALKDGVVIDDRDYRAEARATQKDIMLVGRRQYDRHMPGFDPGFIEVDAYFWREGHMFQATADSLLSLDETARIGEGVGQLGLEKIASLVRPHENGSVPIGPGLCMNRAFLDAPVLASDSFTSTFSDSMKAGLILSISLSHEAAALSERYFDLDYGKSSGARRVDGANGDEVRAYEQPGGPVLYEFAGGEVSDTGAPTRSIRARLVLNADRGAVPAPRLADMIWDHALNSLRMR